MIGIERKNAKPSIILFQMMVIPAGHVTPKGRHGKVLIVRNHRRNKSREINSFAMAFEFLLSHVPCMPASPILHGVKEGNQRRQHGDADEEPAERAPTENRAEEPATEAPGVPLVEFEISVKNVHDVAASRSQAAGDTPGVGLRRAFWRKIGGFDRLGVEEFGK